MSHFSVVVCLPPFERWRTAEPDFRAAVNNAVRKTLAPYDENLDVAPYRQYEEGSPANFWAVDRLRDAGLLGVPDDDLTWVDVAAAHNTHYVEGPQLLVDDVDGVQAAYTMSTSNPKAKWDYWRIGGRRAGHFRAAAGANTGVLWPGEKTLDSPDDLDSNACDGGLRRLMDFDAVRLAAWGDATQRWDEYTKLVEGLPVAQPWGVFVERHELDPEGFPIEEARRAYRTQPRMKALQGSDFQLHDDAIAEFGVPRKEYADQAAARAVSGWALLRLDGEWDAPGEMGWFACHTGTEDSKRAYEDRANAYLEGLDGDAVVVCVDCHI